MDPVEQVDPQPRRLHPERDRGRGQPVPAGARTDTEAPVNERIPGQLWSSPRLGGGGPGDTRTDSAAEIPAAIAAVRHRRQRRVDPPDLPNRPLPPTTLMVAGWLLRANRCVRVRGVHLPVAAILDQLDADRSPSLGPPMGTASAVASLPVIETPEMRRDFAAEPGSWAPSQPEVSPYVVVM